MMEFLLGVENVLNVIIFITTFHEETIAKKNAYLDREMR